MLELEQRRGAMLSGLPAERRDAAVFLRDALLTHLELAKRGAKDAGELALPPPGCKAEQPLGGTAGERGPSFGKTVSAAAAAPPAVRQQSGVAAPPPPARQQSASAAAPWQEARLEPLPTEERDSAVGRWAEAGSGGGAGGSKQAEGGGSGGGAGSGGGGGEAGLLSGRSSAMTAPPDICRGSSYDGGRASIAGGVKAYSGYSAQQSAPQSPRALQKQQSGGAPPPIGAGTTSPRSGAGIAPPGGSSSPLNQSIGRYSGLPANSAAAARGSGADGFAGAGPGLNASLQRSARSSVNAGGGLITPLSPLDQSLKRQAASSGALNQSLGRRITDGTVAAAAASGGSLNQSLGRVGPARPPALVAPQGSGLAAPMNMSLRSAGECG